VTRLRRRARIVGIVTAVILLGLAIVAPRAAAAGWLIAFTSIGAIVLGSVAWILIHALTGGRWASSWRRP